MSPSPSRSRAPARVLACALLAVGCGTGSEVPPLAASSDAPVVGAEVADDPVRQELRALYAACEVRREALVADLDASDRRYARISGAAAVAWLIGQIFDGDTNDPRVYTQNECLAPDGAGVGNARCNPQTVPVVGDDAGYDPAREDVRTVALDARQELTAINRAIDQTDALLFANPDPEAWTEAEWERWRALQAVLDGLCR